MCESFDVVGHGDCAGVSGSGQLVGQGRDMEGALFDAKLP